MYDFTPEDFEEAKKSNSADGIPKGTYRATIERCEKQARDDGREPLYVMFRVTGPTHENAVVHMRLYPPFARDHYQSPDKFLKVKNFFLSQLDELSTACGFRGVPDEASLFIGKKVVIDVTLKTGDYSGNDVKKIKADALNQPQPPSADDVSKPGWA